MTCNGDEHKMTEHHIVGKANGEESNGTEKQMDGNTNGRKSKERNITWQENKHKLSVNTRKRKGKGIQR